VRALLSAISIMTSSRSHKFYPVAEPEIGKLEERYVLDAVRSGWVSSLGEYVTRFETEFAKYCETGEGISTCNGTAALHLALASLGIGRGDEVIVPTLTFVASASAVLYTGAKPVFADADEATWCISANTILAAISPRTRAVIVVHLYGQPADMDPIIEVCSRRGISVIEDAAEAHGALYKGRKVGSIGRVGAFSFYGNKLITTGEGGMLTTNDRDLAERARFLRDHAMSSSERYVHREIGFNYRLTNLQAALGLAQLRRIEQFMERRRKVMQWYRGLLAHRRELILNPELPWARSSNWMVSALFPPSLDSEAVAGRLRQLGVDTRPFFRPMHALPPFRDRKEGRRGGRFPVAESLARRGLNLPTAGRLLQKDIRCIARAVEQVLDEFRGRARETAAL